MADGKLSDRRHRGTHDLTYPYEHLGASPETLSRIAGGEGFAQILREAVRPLVLVGQGALSRPNSPAVAALAAQLAGAVALKADWNGFCVLHTVASRVGALEIGFVPGRRGLSAAAMASKGALDLVFLVGADEIEIPAGTFVVYVGSHGDRGAHRADVVLPAAAYPEKSGIFVNTEGRVQLSARPHSTRRSS